MNYVCKFLFWWCIFNIVNWQALVRPGNINTEVLIPLKCSDAEDTEIDMVFRRGLNNSSYSLDSIIFFGIKNSTLTLYAQKSIKIKKIYLYFL